jgi:hypothetical protein
VNNYSDTDGSKGLKNKSFEGLVRLLHLDLFNYLSHKGGGIWANRRGVVHNLGPEQHPLYSWILIKPLHVENAEQLREFSFFLGGGEKG